jgi:hypothetical protein
MKGRRTGASATRATCSDDSEDKDEPLSIEGLSKFVEFIYWAVIDIAATK